MAGTLTIGTLSDGTYSVASTYCIFGSAKAWVNFVVSTSASQTINASFNVSSVTYVTGSQLTVNFVNGFTDANYLVLGATTQSNINSYNYASQIRDDGIRRTKTTSASPICYYDTVNGQAIPATAINGAVAFFR